MFRRVGFVAAQILFALVLAEIGLQAAALVVQGTTRAGISNTWISGDLRILCLGDSNTYGVIVPRDKTWPAQLESVWSEKVGKPQLETLNLGFPGVNSSVLVRDLPRLLTTFQPHVTIIMVGVNDFWTLPVPVDDVEVPRDSFWKRHSKLYRVYHLIQRGFKKDEVEIIIDAETNMSEGAVNVVRAGEQKFEMGFQEAPQGQQGDSAGLARNLVTLAEQAEAGGTKLFFMSYPARHAFYRETNPIIWGAAAATGTPLINLTKVFREFCPEEACPTHMTWDNHHPNIEGYRVIAEKVTADLLPVLPELRISSPEPE